MEQFFFTLLSGAITFFCLYSVMQKKPAVIFSTAVMLIICLGTRTPEDYQSHPEKFDKLFITTLENKGETLASAGIRLEKCSMLEQTGDLLVIVFGLAVIFGLAIYSDLKNLEAKEYLLMVKKKFLSVLIAVIMYLLSLYHGLPLTLIPLPAHMKSYTKKLFA